MTRYIFGGTSADVAEDITGAREPGALGTVWDGPGDDANQLTDLTDLDGNELGQLVADEQGMIPRFMGPEDVEIVWVDFGAGRYALVATDIGTRLKEHVLNIEEDPHGFHEYADSTFIKQSDAEWITNPNGLATKKGVLVPREWGNLWRPKRDAARDGVDKATIAVIGGSDVVGFYASQLIHKSWPGVLAAELQADNGDGGSGFVSSLFSANGIAGNEASAINQWTNNGGLVEQNGSWSLGGYAVGPGWGYLYTSTPGDSMTWTVRGSEVTIYTLGGDGNRPNWSYSIDGGSETTVTDSDTSGLAVRKTVVSGLSEDVHTVQVKHAGSSGQYLSVCGVSAENDTGIVVNNFGRKNANAAQYLPSGKVEWNAGGSYPADLVIYVVSPQDVVDGVAVDTWASQVRQHLSEVKDGGSNVGATDLVLVLPHIGKADIHSFRFQDFADRAYALAATFDAAVVDFWNLGRNSWNYWASLGYWGNPSAPGTAGDDPHLLSDAGHEHVASVLAELLDS